MTRVQVDTRTEGHVYRLTRVSMINFSARKMRFVVLCRVRVLLFFVCVCSSLFFLKLLSEAKLDAN